NFEDHINVVKQTLQEIGAGNKPTILVFNKTDAFSYTKKDEDDLSPVKKENLSLADVKRTWMKSMNKPVIFISAQKRENVEELRNTLYEMVKELHNKRYP